MKDVGVLVLPTLKDQSKPLIRKYMKGVNVISNYVLDIPHTFIKFTDEKPKSIVFGDNTIRIPKSEAQLGLSTDVTRYLSMLTELRKRSDKLLIVAPNKAPLLFLIVAMGMYDVSNVKLIVGDKLADIPTIMKSIDKKTLEQLKREWNNITGKSNVVAPKKYKPEELTKTPNGATLRAYQQQMMDFALKVKRAGLFIDMGLGKTLATLATINKLAQEGNIDTTKPVLIVAPIMVALDTWSREAEKWGYDMDVAINIRLTPKKREELFDKLIQPQEKLTLLTTNPAQLKSMLEYFESKRLRPPFEVVVVDELSQFKSATAQRFTQLTKLTRHVEYFFGLTGTPAPNNLLDVWSQLIAIDPKNQKYFMYNFYEYRSKFFMPDKIGRDGQVYTWKLKPNAEDEIYQRMRNSVISMRSEGLIDLPDIILDKRYVKLPSKVRKIYDKLDKEIRYKLLENDSDDYVTTEIEGSEMTLPNNAVLQGKLSQVTSGAIYDNIIDDTASSTNYTVIHDEKFKMLKDIVENSTSPILVFYNFQSELERLPDYIEFEHLNSKRDDVKEVIAKWNRGEIPVMAAHPESVGHGLNLQDGGHTIVWLTTTWSNEVYRQALKRLHRSGQKHTVSNIHIVVENSVDDEIIDRVNEKEENQNKLMEALDVADRG